MKAVRELVSDGRWEPRNSRLQALDPRTLHLKNWFMAFTLINAVLHVVFGGVIIPNDFFPLSIPAAADVAPAAHHLKNHTKMNTLWLYIQHQRAQIGKKPLRCCDCGKGFDGNSDLTQHQLVHTGKKAYLCAPCGKSWGQNSSLTRHQWTLKWWERKRRSKKRSRVSGVSRTANGIFGALRAVYMLGW